ncbi:MAG: hypothetical protein J0I98_10620 [Mesorhizobium sp.]|nr:hypothetical protein [Mesorhizobium sp.]MBN9243236.1 hypothetical protein [Mesorhizobium sp.]
MARCVLVIFTNAAEGREQEYLDWYDKHLDHMLELEDCLSAQHFTQVDYTDDRHHRGPHQYLAIYEFETDDVPATQARLSARLGGPTMPNSDAKTDTTGWYFAEIGPKRVK